MTAEFAASLPRAVWGTLGIMIGFLIYMMYGWPLAAALHLAGQHIFVHRRQNGIELTGLLTVLMLAALMVPFALIRPTLAF